MQPLYSSNNKRNLGKGGNILENGEEREEESDQYERPKTNQNMTETQYNRYLNNLLLEENKENFDEESSRRRH